MEEQRECALDPREKQSFPRRVWPTRSCADSGSSARRPGKHPFGCDHPVVMSSVVSTVSSGHGVRSQVPESVRGVGGEQLKGPG